MALAFRNATTQGNASAGSLTVTKPTGTVDGDILLAWAYLETNTNSWATVPAGWTAIALTGASNAGKFRMDLWWKRAASEGASWAWIPTTNAWRTIACVAYSSNTGTGTPIDVTGTFANGNAVNLAAPSITTTAANDMLLGLGGNFQGAAFTESGAAATERVDFGGIVVSEALRVSAGATGTTTFGAGSADYVVGHTSLLLTSSGAAASASSLPRRGPWRIWTRR